MNRPTTKQPEPTLKEREWGGGGGGGGGRERGGGERERERERETTKRQLAVSTTLGGQREHVRTIYYTTGNDPSIESFSLVLFTAAHFAARGTQRSLRL